MAQFSVEITRLSGSLLGGNQQAMALLLVAALAVTLLCARLLRLPGESLVSLCLSVLIPVAAVPMALGLMAGAPSVAFAGAAYAVLGYLLAFLLIGARLRRARRR
ncbi:hypothetical protein [uncultured Paracoccus sp.]|uniref:hypothetical protein n=1 Tax=uncultured Paracoccus sp. TaxID=189685 RepID=UPI00261C803F|nr:hypothetical protein [uncultured Paracoccus sp.]